jgi:hypothetical protein
MAASEKDIEETMKLFNKNAALLLKTSPGVKDILLSNSSSPDHVGLGKPDVSQPKVGSAKSVVSASQTSPVATHATHTPSVRPSVNAVGSAKSPATSRNVSNSAFRKPPPNVEVPRSSTVTSSANVPKDINELPRTEEPSVSVSKLMKKFAVPASQNLSNDSSPERNSKHLPAQHVSICASNTANNERLSPINASPVSTITCTHGDNDEEVKQVSVIAHSSHVHQDARETGHCNDNCQLQCDSKSSTVDCTTDVHSSVTSLDPRDDQTNEDNLHHVAAETNKDSVEHRLTSSDTCKLSTAEEAASSNNKPAEVETVCKTDEPVGTELQKSVVSAEAVEVDVVNVHNKPAEPDKTEAAVRTEPEKTVVPEEAARVDVMSTVAVLRATSLRRKGSAIVSFTTEDFDLFHSELEYSYLC